MDAKPHPEPVFVVADDDRDARDRMVGLCSPYYFFIPVRTGEEALRYAKYFRPSGVAGVLLSETTRVHADGGGVAEEVLAALLAEGVRVVVLMELPDAASAARWKERGAFACIGHPTRIVRRMERLHEVLEELASLLWQEEAGEAGETA